MTRIRALTVLLLVAWLGLSCASTPDPVLCGQIGLALGMGGGAYGGSTSDSGDAGPVIGYGALGAVVGGAGGYLLCKALEKEEPPPPPAPKAEPKPAPPPPPPPAEPKTDPCDQVIRLRGVNFDFDKAVIREDASVVLDEAAILLGESLAQCTSRRVIVEGYTDATGPEAYNQTLSERRAKSVRSYLESKGVEGSRLEARGYGEANPIADNATREGRALNRRVELRMTQ